MCIQASWNWTAHFEHRLFDYFGRGDMGEVWESRRLSMHKTVFLLSKDSNLYDPAVVQMMRPTRLLLCFAAKSLDKENRLGGGNKAESINSIPSDVQCWPTSRSTWKASMRLLQATAIQRSTILTE